MNVLKTCHLEQYYNYLSRHGFTCLRTLQLLNISDQKHLNKISYGHLKLIIKTTQCFVERKSIITSKYKEYLTLLQQSPSPIAIFPDIDDQFAQYQRIKQEYTQNWSKHQQYHNKISNALKTC